MQMISDKTIIVTNKLGISATFEAGVPRAVRADLVELAVEAGAKAIETEKVEEKKPAPARRTVKKDSTPLEE